MDKSLLLHRLSSVQARADAANFEVVVRTSLVAQAKKQGRLTEKMAVKLNTWKMTEQKLLRELDWTLDQIDQVERDKRG